MIHVSEMSWTKKIRHPSKVVQLGQEVDAVVKEIDVEHKRISVHERSRAESLETCSGPLPIGSVVTGRVRNITDFGIFVGLDEGIDGLVHVSDISGHSAKENLRRLLAKVRKLKLRF